MARAAASADACQWRYLHVPQGAFEKNTGDQLAELAKVCEPGLQRHYGGMARNLRRTLVSEHGLSPIGLLRSCLDHALHGKAKPGGVFAAVTQGFKVAGARKLLAQVEAVNNFRNTHVAHAEQALKDYQQAEQALKEWIHCLAAIHRFNPPQQRQGIK